MPAKDTDLRKVRRQHVQRLNAIAKKHGASATKNDTAKKEDVEALIATLRSQTAMAESQKQELEDAAAQYSATFGAVPESSESGDAEGAVARDVSQQDQNAEGGACEKGKQWEFHAAQLTYNCTQGEWSSQDADVLCALFARFVTWLRAARRRSGALNCDLHVFTGNEVDFTPVAALPASAAASL